MHGTPEVGKLLGRALHVHTEARRLAFPELWVARQCTVVSPIGKTLPVAGVQTTIGFGSASSVAVTA